MHNIIIEGADATGKSTLASHLQLHLKMPVKESEGPTKDVDDFLERIKRYDILENTIIVRHPHVSERIYGKARGTYNTYFRSYDFRESYNQYLRSKTLTIYCEPLQTIHTEAHVLKEYDTADHLKLLSDHGKRIIDLYNLWAQHNADLFYKIGNGKNRLLGVINALRFDPLGDIKQFHEKFGLVYDGQPHSLPLTLSQFRFNFLEEELLEYADATHRANDPHNSNGGSNELVAEALEDCLDSLVDLSYVAFGTSYLHGFNDILAEAWRRVHRANMKKVRSESKIESGDRGSTYDIVKPPGWVSPSLLDLVQPDTTTDSIPEGG